MPIGASRPVAGLASTTNSATYAMTAFTPTANSLLCLLIYGTGTVAASPTVTNTGTTLTWVKQEQRQLGSDTFMLWYAKVPSTVSSSVITVNFVGDAATGCVISAFAFTGYDNVTANPIRQHNMSSGVTTVPTTPNVWAGGTTDILNGIAGAWVGTLAANTSLPPTGWTEGDDMAYGTPATNMSSAFRAGGENSPSAYSFTANAGVNGWKSCGFEIWAAGLGPAPPATKRLSLLGVG